MLKNIIRNRPRVGSITLAICVALYIVATFNWTFWTRLFNYFHYDGGPIIAIIVGISCLFIALTVCVSVKYLIKPIFILLILISSASSWFTDQFGTIIDRDMIANMVETTVAEAGNLVSLGLVLHLLITGVLPSLLILWIKIKHRSIFKKIVTNSVVIISCLMITLFCSLSISRNLISTFREHQDLVKILNPIVPINSFVKYVIHDAQSQPRVFERMGEDARIAPPKNSGGRPRITVVVAGETARAEDFSLQGYAQPTNPELEKRDVLYFANTTSCGTATAQSIPCMFSPLTQSQFSVEKANAMSSLPDVLQNAGIKVEWWENNTGSKGVSDRIKTVIFYGGTDPRYCIDGECQDGIMLNKLDAWLDTVDKDTVLFIHQLGSHGPAYYKRYPEEFRRFIPDCRGLEFSKCTPESVRNAYDNTILYTDYFLSTIIDKLKQRDKKLDGALFYMSDHGESLGENGLYLHGMPYELAPVQQTHIPFILWMEPAFAETMAVNIDCLKKKTISAAMSHDNLFPSVLSMMNVETKIKDSRLDMFAGCHFNPVAM